MTMPSHERDYNAHWTSQDPYNQYSAPMTQAHQQYVPLAPLYDQQLRPNGLTFPQHELDYQHYSSAENLYGQAAPGPSASFAPPQAQPYPASETMFTTGTSQYSHAYSYPLSQPQEQSLYLAQQHHSTSTRPSPSSSSLLYEHLPPVLPPAISQPYSAPLSTSLPHYSFYPPADEPSRAVIAETSAQRRHGKEDRQVGLDWHSAPYQVYKGLHEPVPVPQAVPAPSSAPLERRSLSAGSPQLSERSVGSDEERGERQDAVTPFVSKLSHMLNNPEYDDVIRWNRDGTAFTFAHGSSEFLAVLGSFFRHSNVHSFVRQLNIYAFTRLTSLDLVDALDGCPSSAAGEFSGFYHPLLFRDSPGRVCDLTKIKPKIAKKPSRAKSNPNLAPDVRKHTIKTDGKVSGGAKGRKMS